MKKEPNAVGFAAIVCLICSVLLAGVSSGLKAEQERNKALDVRTKVLTTFGIEVTDAKGRPLMNAEEISEIFETRIESLVLDSSGKPTETSVADLTVEQINKRDESGAKEYYPLYIYTDPELGRKRYAIHVSGRGLWSVVKGYLAVEDDFSTVAGIAFYEHQETPGLGGEIEKDFFQDRFKGKTFLQDGQLVTFRIVKSGQRVDEHSVDGITAATMTCKGVTAFINSDFAVYHSYFDTIRDR